MSMSVCRRRASEVISKFRENINKKSSSSKPFKWLFINALMSHTPYEKVPRIQVFLSPAFQVLVQIFLAVLSALANKAGG